MKHNSQANHDQPVLATNSHNECVKAIENANMRYFSYMEGDLSIVDLNICVRHFEDEVHVIQANGAYSLELQEACNPVIWRGQAGDLPAILIQLKEERRVDSVANLSKARTH